MLLAFPAFLVAAAGATPFIAAAGCGAGWLDVGETPPFAPADAIAALSGDAGFSRTRFAASLVLAGVAPLLVVSGSGWGGDDAYQMVEAASAAGLRGDCVIVEPAARDTRENVLRLAEMARARSWRELLVVTSPTHTRRVRLLAARLAPGLRFRVASAPPTPGVPAVDTAALTGEYARLFVQSLIIW